MDDEVAKTALRHTCSPLVPPRKPRGRARTLPKKLRGAEVTPGLPDHNGLRARLRQTRPPNSDANPGSPRVLLLRELLSRPRGVGLDHSNRRQHRSKHTNDQRGPGNPTRRIIIIIIIIVVVVVVIALVVIIIGDNSGSGGRGDSGTSLRRHLRRLELRQQGLLLHVREAAALRADRVQLHPVSHHGVHFESHVNGADGELDGCHGRLILGLHRSGHRHESVGAHEGLAPV
mmetsp:Transcript_4773/g.9941  ORF Transcript_4773/g.9941 Transcript_4773/m.9941 type:complete len:231 (+) Transcript_4773:101-793(+)